MGQNVAATVTGPAPRMTETDDESVDSVAADLELVAKKLADVTRRATRDRDMEAAHAAAAAEHERRARETAEKTAAALDSVAQWVERTEGRLSETARAASEGQERTAGMLNEAIGLMTRRLDEIERKITDAGQPSVDAALTAMQRIETQMAKLGRDESGRADNPHEAALRGMGERIAQAAERIKQGAPRDGQSKPDPRTELTSAIEEIRSRQSELEQASAGRASAARSQTELLRSLRDDFARFAGQIDKSRAGLDAGEAAREMREEIARLRGSLGELVTRQDLDALERVVHDLNAKVGAAGGAGRDLAEIAQPLAAVQAELRRLAEGVAADMQARAALDLPALARRLDGIDGLGGVVAERISGEFDQVRTLLKDMAEPHRVRSLAEQVAALNHQVAQVRRQFGNSDLAALAATVDEIRAAVTAQSQEAPHAGSIGHELERLSARIDGALAAAGNPVGVDALIERLDSLNDNLGRSRGDDGRLKTIEDMVRGLADRPSESGAIEEQMALLAERIEDASRQPALAFLERAMRDLLAGMERLRGDVAEAAERAVRSAVIHTVQSLPRPIGGPDVDTLQKELAGLKAAQDESGKWTQDTLSAVHATLDKVIARLAPADGDAAPIGPKAKPADDHASPAKDARLPKAGPSSKQVEESLRKLEAELVPHLSAGPARREPPRGVAAAEEILLEPGEGRPAAREQAPPRPVPHNSPVEAADIKASFIAAARRAAQAASESAAAKEKSTARRSRVARAGAFKRDGGHVAGRVKRTLDERRRPILLTLGTIVLTLSALQIGNDYRQQPGTAALVAAPRESRIAAAPPAPQPREPAAIAAPADAGDPRTTAGIPSETAWQPAAAPQPLSESAARERDIEADAKSVRLDAPKAEPKEDFTIAAPVAAMPERISNMGSAGPIPANAGPASLRQAAMAGDPAAVYELAARLAEGRGMARDLALAARLFEKAAAHGLAPAQYRTGKLYEKGLGVARDLVIAKGWYQRAAERGNALAMHHLAVLVAEGVGGKPDYATAIAWFRRAAQHGVRDSQFNLAVLLARGLGTPQDMTGSYTWFAIVAAQGDEEAAKKRDEVGARLGAAELAAAKLAAERWRPETPDKVANEVAPPTPGWSEAPQPKRTASTGRM